MIKKAISHSFKALKTSIWVGIIAAVLLSLLVGFFIVFPTLLKMPIETQLSNMSGFDVQLSKIGFGFEDKGLVLRVSDIEALDETRQQVATFENLYWHVSLIQLLGDAYRPNKIYLDKLVLSPNFDKDLTLEDFVANALQVLSFLDFISVKQTLIKDETEIKIAPLTLKRQDLTWQLNIENQTIVNNKFNIQAVLPSPKDIQDGPLILPISINTEAFKLAADLEIYEQKNEIFIHLNGDIQRINASDINQYFPKQLIGGAMSDWLKRGLISGQLEDININFRKSLFANNTPQTRITAHFLDTELHFHPDWGNLKQADADLLIDNTRIQIQVNQAKLYDLPLNNISVWLNDITAPKINIEVAGKIENRSERLMKFLLQSPLGVEVDEMFSKFSLSGAADADVKLILPIDEKKRALRVNVELSVVDNQLKSLNDVVELNHYQAKIYYDNGKLTTRGGSGDIRGVGFDIDLDLDTNKTDDFFLVLRNEAKDLRITLDKTSIHSWQAKIESPTVSSELSLDLTNSVPNVELKDLHINSATLNDIDFKLLPSDLPDMHLKSKGAYLNDYPLPDFKVDLHSQGNQLNINNLEFEGIGVTQQSLSFNGSWLKGITTLSTKARGDKLSDFLQKLKIKEAVEGGEFEIDIRLFCACAPWEVSLQNISGYVEMKIQQGVFSEKDPNIGRVLSLLNIQSIARRLKLDVNDLISKGFVYDDIYVSAYFADALLNIEDFKLRASSSTIELSGNSDLLNQQYHLLAQVRPAISDAVPIATYLAGGGLAGLGVWVLDKTLFDGKMIDSLVDKVVEFDYKITGSWDEPIIEKYSDE